MSILIVLFGQENEPNGGLRAPAAARAAKAAEVFKELAPGNETVVLPTGAFGKHFNTSDLPHFHYLTEELISRGVPPENILPGVAGSHTIQDATEAWYRFKSGGHHRLVAVTSDYHAARVAFILGRLSANDDAQIEVIPAATPASYTGKDKDLEERKLAALRKDWVDVIPRTSKVAPERFVAAYDNAARELHYHNTLSFVVIAALLAVNAFAFLIVPGNSGWVLFLFLLLLAIVDGLLWLLFYRLNGAAHTALRVVNRMEIEHRIPGFVSNWQMANTQWFRSPPWMWSLREIVTALSVALFLAVAILSLASRTEPREEPAPNRSSSTAANTNSNASATPVFAGNGNAVDRFANAVMSSQDNSNANTNRRRRR